MSGFHSESDDSKDSENLKQKQATTYNVKVSLLFSASLSGSVPPQAPAATSPGHPSQVEVPELVVANWAMSLARLHDSLYAT
jgi:hypothetical protein